MKEVQRIDIAAEQLTDALEAYFDRRFHSATVLAGAAESDIGDLMNRAYNHSKHAGTKDHTVWMDPESEAREFVDRAISNYDALFGHCGYHLPGLPLAQRFRQQYAKRVAFLENDGAA